MNKQSPREFWVFEDSNCYGDVGDYAAKAGVQLKPIHVIEKSYADSLAAELASLKESRRREVRADMVDELKRLQSELASLKVENEKLVEKGINLCLQNGNLLMELARKDEALKFYAKRKHFEWCGSDDYEPENPSGEPLNWESGGAEGSEFNLENGGVARQALSPKGGVK